MTLFVCFSRINYRAIINETEGHVIDNPTCQASETALIISIETYSNITNPKDKATHTAMEMQGTPIGSTNQGTKNTSDPERYSNPTSEGAGAIASDSLAAESATSGGKFGENRDSNPLSVKGDHSTLNNTDTSGAKVLAPASNAAEREEKEALEETPGEAKGQHGKKYPEGADGQSDIQGHSLDGKPASGLRGATGPSSSMGTSGQEAGSENKSGPTENTFKGEGGADVDAAPGYVGSVVSEANKTGKPKGKNITEGGFDDDPSNNASFTSDIGTDNDPGRKAEADMQKISQSASGGTGPRQAPGESDNSQYDVLDADQAA